MEYGICVSNMGGMSGFEYTSIFGYEKFIRHALPVYVYVAKVPGGDMDTMKNSLGYRHSTGPIVCKVLVYPTEQVYLYIQYLSTLQNKYTYTYSTARWTVHVFGPKY
jgi:hypothetical protein